MTEQLISYETAQLAKRAGFDLETRYYYEYKRWGERPIASFGPMNHNNSRRWDNDKCQYVESDIRQSAPTLDLVQKWLREQHGLYTLPTIDLQIPHWLCNHYFVNKEGEFTQIFLGTTMQWPSYESALEDGLKYALNFVIEELI